MVLEDWLERWQQGRIGWHEPDGNAYLKQHWPSLAAGSTVLVPLCGKSADLIWLASRGLDVTGIELSDIAIQAFFVENNLDYTLDKIGRLDCYCASSMPIRLYRGDYFDYAGQPFDALFDRGALGTMSETERASYVEHTKSLLARDSFRMIITLEYDQDKVTGPPFSVLADELMRYWPDLRQIASHDDIENSPPKFRDAGLAEMREAIWTSG